MNRTRLNPSVHFQSNQKSMLSALRRWGRRTRSLGTAWLDEESWEAEIIFFLHKYPQKHTHKTPPKEPELAVSPAIFRNALVCSRSS